MIDPHVHCRDGKQAYKETIAHTLEIAREQGVEKIFDMPNTDPPILSRTDASERLKLVPKNKWENYYLYVGATSDEKQLEEAFICYDVYTEVIGIKMFAGQSVGNLAIIEPKKQWGVYKKLSELEYKGVLAVHCEKEAHINKDIWEPSKPITHSQARPKQAEIEAIKDQIAFAKETNFQGNLHICHVSCPESVKLVDSARQDGKIRITCGATPHHILWDMEMQKRPEGLMYKMNPPLRDWDDVSGMRQLLRENKIDWIETDHAPHAIGEKLFAPYISGYPSLYLYKNFVTEFLPSIGLDEKQINSLTDGNIRKAFTNKL
jgi:dihydroorotase